MNPILKNVLAVIAGILIGGLVNGSLVELGYSIIPPPEGAELTPDKFAETVKLFGPKHFIFPFLAHALGTLVAAFTVAKLAANNKMKFALGIGFLFLLLGIYAVYLFGGPLWFKILDLIGAYLPMGWLGGRLAAK